MKKPSWLCRETGTSRTLRPSCSHACSGAVHRDVGGAPSTFYAPRGETSSISVHPRLRESAVRAPPAPTVRTASLARGSCSVASLSRSSMRRPQGPLCDDLRRVPVVCVARGCVSLAYDGRSRKLYRLLGGPRGTAYADPTPNGNAAAQTVATGADCGQHVLVTPHRIWTLIQQVPSLRPAPTRSEPTSRPCHPAPAAPSRPWLF